MEIELLRQSDSAIARVKSNTREELIAEAGAMSAMSER
ncbi:AIM24 family protein [Myxosarcina sp. GI1]|nr:AIM24 family protein [Myxosarcina sp. GI1]